MKIRIITPITTKGVTNADEFAYVVDETTELSHRDLDVGPASIESYYDEAMALPGTVGRIVEAEQDGCDAVVIDCMGDPGLLGGREAVDIPVVGPSEVSMHLAAMLAHNFTVVTVLDRLIPLFHNIARHAGLEDRLCSVRAVDIPVLELSDEERLAKALAEESIRAIEEDGAHAIVLGCTLMKQHPDSITQALEDRGHHQVPVINPVPAALKIAEALGALGLSHSKLTYADSPSKPIQGLDAVLPGPVS